MKAAVSLALLLLPLAPMSAALATAQDEVAPAAPDRATLEAEFARKMSGAVLVGKFTDDAMPSDAPLQEDRYTLGAVTKVEGEENAWRFETIIEYGGKSFTMPLVLDVMWAGDTPVITLTDKKIPMMGAFTSRVVIYGDEYVGLWRGAQHGGHMFGRIERPAAAGDAEGGAVVPPPSGEDDEGRYVQWPAFHGRGGMGVADGFSTVEEWDVENGENIRWKTRIPGLSHSSPVIWGDKLFVIAAVKEDGGEAELKVGLYGSIEPVADEGVHEYRLYCLDKNSGDVLWNKTSWKGVPAVKRHPKGSHASSSPATDGRYVVAFYGSEGLFCYDMDGNLLWDKSFGLLDSGYYMVPDAQWGFSSSPAIHADRVVVQCDVQQDSFVAALDLRTGEELWRTPRDEVPTWSTPTIDVREGRSQVICNGYKHIGGYDLETGAELWKLVGGGDIPVPTPIVAHDLIFVTNAHGRMAPIYAIEALAEGDVEMDGNGMAWSTRTMGNYMQTPLVYDTLLFACGDGGTFSCRDAGTGDVFFRERIGTGRSSFTASLIAADGKIYATADDGEVFVMPAITEFEMIATNHLGEECMATPAVSEGVMYWRTRSQIVAVGR